MEGKQTCHFKVSQEEVQAFIDKLINAEDIVIASRRVGESGKKN